MQREVKTLPDLEILVDFVDVRIWNESGIIAEAHWDGYKEDWHNLTFPKSFILEAGTRYNYTIRTGSYPQIHHNTTLTVPDGRCSDNSSTL